MRSFISIGGIMGRASKKTIAELEKLQTKAVRKLARQRNLQKDLGTDEFHYQYDIWSMDMSRIGPKKAEKVKQELNDYLSPAGAIVRVNNRNETDTYGDGKIVNGKWTSFVEHHDEYVTLKDMKAMKENLKFTNKMSRVFDKALKKARVHKAKKDGKVVKIESTDTIPTYGEDPGLLITTVDVGEKTLGRGRKNQSAGRHKSAKTREKFFATSSSLKKKADYFKKTKVADAKNNFIKMIRSQISPSYARKVRRDLKGVNPVEFYFLQKATEGFQFDFFYDEEELKTKRDVMKATLEAFRNGMFKEEYEDFRHVLGEAGIIEIKSGSSYGED